MRGDDVRALLEQETRYGRDDPGLVRTADQQTRGVTLVIVARDSGLGGPVATLRVRLDIWPNTLWARLDTRLDMLLARPYAPLRLLPARLNAELDMLRVRLDGTLEMALGTRLRGILWEGAERAVGLLGSAHLTENSVQAISAW